MWHIESEGTGGATVTFCPGLKVSEFTSKPKDRTGVLGEQQEGKTVSQKGSNFGPSTQFTRNSRETSGRKILTPGNSKGGLSPKVLVSRKTFILLGRGVNLFCYSNRFPMTSVVTNPSEWLCVICTTSKSR